MTTTAEMIRRIEGIDFQSVMEDAVEQTKGDFVKENLDQMNAGKTKDQTSITPLYAPKTVAYKKRKGQPYDRVTLKDKGDLYAKTGAIVDNDAIRIGSDVPYADSLQKKYGDGIWGIGGQYQENYVAVLNPVFIGDIKDKTGMT